MSSRTVAVIITCCLGIIAILANEFNTFEIVMFYDNYLQNINISTVIEYEAFIKSDAGKPRYPFRCIWGTIWFSALFNFFVIFFCRYIFLFDKVMLMCKSRVSTIITNFHPQYFNFYSI